VQYVEQSSLPRCADTHDPRNANLLDKESPRR
jgi:hypothetical protein